MENTEETDDGAIRKKMERDGTDGNSHRTYGYGRKQAGMSQESRRTMEKVQENTTPGKSSEVPLATWTTSAIKIGEVTIFFQPLARLPSPQPLIWDPHSATPLQQLRQVIKLKCKSIIQLPPYI